MITELLEHPAIQGAFFGVLLTAGGALVRLLTRQARMDERLLDIEEDLKTTEAVLPAMWKSIKNVEVTVVRLDERQTSGSKQLYTHLEQLSTDIDKLEKRRV